MDNLERVMRYGVWSGRRWTVSVAPQRFSGDSRGTRITVTGSDVSHLELRRRWFRWEVRSPQDRLMQLPGLSRGDARAIRAQLRLSEFFNRITAARKWSQRMSQTLDDHLDEQRWIPREVRERLEQSRPEFGLKDTLVAADVWTELDAEDRLSIETLDDDLSARIAALNEKIMARELIDRAEFFRTIERSPLTEEQARAVICFDNRVQVLAAAGSGKTSVMVARAAYAVHRGFVAPERILLLAFNKSAAQELQERVKERFGAAGIDAEGVRSATFHAFGMDCIGRATGKRPSLGRWLEFEGDTRKILEIADSLKQSDQDFHTAWEQFRLIYGRDHGDDSAEPDTRHPETKETGFRTYAGHPVRSGEERRIANQLFLWGIDYEYERDYIVDLASESHRQYRPDFYYREPLDAWHEHWGIDKHGRPRDDAHGYLESMQWKRDTHASYGTDLVETTSGELNGEVGLDGLKGELRRRGATVDIDPERVRSADRTGLALKPNALAKLVSTFMAHVKSSRLTRADIEERLAAAGDSQHRTRVFLNAYWKIHERWETELRAENSIDYADMLLMASDLIDEGRHEPAYDLILVDELQDTSRARAQLLKSILGRNDQYLLAVGDDWQAINRFAGSDISVMTEFADWFGAGPQLALTQTFRCTQTICDVARTFVMKNPSQFDKQMTSVYGPGGASVHIQGPPPVPDDEVDTRSADERTRASVEYALYRISEDVRKGLLKASKSDRVAVDVLGRYRFEREQAMPNRIPKNLIVNFRTVHAAKGLEADCIIVPRLLTDTYGFPSTIVDDPVLNLAMPQPDRFLNAEERRLLYVALTRARQRVVLCTLNENPSSFIHELIADMKASGKVTSEFVEDGILRACPRCERGYLKVVKYKPNSFIGCSRYASCTYAESLTPKSRTNVTLRGATNAPVRRRNTARTPEPGTRCPRCDEGPMERQPSKNGIFLSCRNYPDCSGSRII